MIEPKFRLWDNHMKKMVDPDHFAITAKGRLIWRQANMWGLTSEYDEEPLNLPEYFNLMQYIGLKSRSGVDICEGDIVASYRPKHLGGGQRELRVVERKQSRILNGWSVAKGEIYEILGNVYENPEMLDER